MNRFDEATVARLAERAGDPPWLAEARAEAFGRFESLPWPEQSLEEWRHTDIRGLDLDAFDPVPPRAKPVAALEELPEGIRALAIGEKGERLGLAVRLDADLVHRRLSPRLAEQGVVLAPLQEVAAEHPGLVRDHLGRAGVSDTEAKFAALNAAFSGGGTFVYVPRGVRVELPLQVVRWISRAGVAVFPRVLIVVEEGAELTYIDHFGARPLGGEALAVPVVEIHAGPGANVSYLCVQDWPQDVWHFGILRAVAERDATVRTLTATLGAKLSRSVAQSVLDGQGAHAEMLGIYFGDHAQHIDHRTLQLHRAPDTSSELYYKGALKGTARAIYTGLVDIEKEARRADAVQANRNLLLSSGASALPDPFLEIKTSEVVRATHAVSVGRPDRDVLFYLASRGLDPAEAERVFVTGFFQEVIDRVRVAQIREMLERAVLSELALED